MGIMATSGSARFLKPWIVAVPPSRWLADRSPLTEKALKWARSQVRDWLKLKAPSAVISPALVEQLARHTLGALELFGSRRFEFDVFAIYEAIADVQDPSRRSRSRKHSAFGPEPQAFLSGLKHKHFFDAQFLPRNLKEEVERSFDVLFYRDFQQRRRELGLADEASVEKLAGLLAHTITFGALERRSMARDGRARRGTRFTGEWIVFAETPQGNVFLTLATHEQAEQHPAELRSRILEAVNAIEQSELRDEIFAKFPLLARPD